MSKDTINSQTQHLVRFGSLIINLNNLLFGVFLQKRGADDEITERWLKLVFVSGEEIKVPEQDFPETKKVLKKLSFGLDPDEMVEVKRLNRAKEYEQFLRKARERFPDFTEAIDAQIKSAQAAQSPTD